jgi:hypothetical protein
MGKQAEGDSRRAMCRNLVISPADDTTLIERRLLDLASERGIDSHSPSRHSILTVMQSSGPACRRVSDLGNHPMLALQAGFGRRNHASARM